MLRKTAPEQRVPFYEDVEALIAPGFLSKTATVRGVPISFRSLYPRDLFLLKNYNNGGRDWRIWTVASSIWIVDGLSLFRAGTDVIPILAKWLETLPPGYIDRLFAITKTLYERSKEAMDDVQPYLYEGRSRQLWNSTGKGNAFDDRFFGLPGVETLGRNHVQRVWMVWNQNEDQASTDRFHWQMTKTSMSPHAPKGVRRMNATDTTRERGERERRERVLDMFYYRKMGILGEDAMLYDANGNPITRIGGASTPAELSEEFYRWVRGEEDPHDMVVNQIKEGILRSMREKEEARQRVLEERRVSYEEQDGLYSYISENQVNELSAGEGRDGVRQVYGQDLPPKALAWVGETQPPLPDDQMELLYQPADTQQKTRPDVNRMIQSRLPKVN